MWLVRVSNKAMFYKALNESCCAVVAFFTVNEYQISKIEISVSTRNRNQHQRLRLQLIPKVVKPELVVPIPVPVPDNEKPI